MKRRNLIKLASAFALVTMLGLGIHSKAYALGATSSIDSVTIGSNKTTVDITMNNSGDMSGTDGNFYLFELQPYEDGIGNRTDYLEKLSAGSVTKSYQLNKGSDNSRLYNSYVVALAIDGKKYTSESFAKRMENYDILSKGNLTFVIGGSLGLHESVLKRADERLSFSDMTFPHQLMRVILLEQIYRAYRIRNNEPYHK